MRELVGGEGVWCRFCCDVLTYHLGPCSFKLAGEAEYWNRILYDHLSMIQQNVVVVAVK